MPVPLPVQALLLDLLMGVMDSPAIWAGAAGSPETGIAWRDAAIARMRAAEHYLPYMQVVAEAARDAGVDREAPERLIRAWPEMRPWPDAIALAVSTKPYGFVTNCSRLLAEIAARGSGLTPRLVLSAEEVGAFKPAATIYHEACRRMGTEPAQTVFVAGSPYDAAGAHAAGLDAWLVIRRPGAEPPTGVKGAASLTEIVAAIERRPPQWI